MKATGFRRLEEKGWSQKAGCIRLVAEGRKQRAGRRRLAAKGWSPKAGSKGLVAEGWLQKAGCRRLAVKWLGAEMNRRENGWCLMMRCFDAAYHKRQPLYFSCRILPSVARWNAKGGEWSLSLAGVRESRLLSFSHNADAECRQRKRCAIKHNFI